MELNPDLLVDYMFATAIALGHTPNRENMDKIRLSLEAGAKWYMAASIMMGKVDEDVIGTRYLHTIALCCEWKSPVIHTEVIDANDALIKGVRVKDKIVQSQIHWGPNSYI